jgi:hypothetical protein
LPSFSSLLVLVGADLCVCPSPATQSVKNSKGEHTGSPLQIEIIPSANRKPFGQSRSKSSEIPYQQLGDLHGVGSRAFAEVFGDDKSLAKLLSLKNVSFFKKAFNLFCRWLWNIFS